jgi:hypothetical protein
LTPCCPGAPALAPPAPPGAPKPPRPLAGVGAVPAVAAVATRATGSELLAGTRTAGPAVAASLNNLIKRIGYCFTNFENYRIRALLYAGKPNWRVLGSIVVQ